MRLVTESFAGARATGSAGHLSAAATATSDLDITVLTHDSDRHPGHQTGAAAGGDLIGAQLAGSARGCARSITSMGAAGSTTLGLRRHRDRLRGQHLDAPRLIRQRGGLLLLVQSPREATVRHRELPGLRLG
ncbi:MAG TPA: hypothetical protein VNT24_06715 [Propionibacteriaceae bacterium]|nr:hypothetical protein [Propionibacteriaceae bacterium]